MLTGQEHFRAHCLLIKIIPESNPGYYKMLQGVNYMCNGRQRKYNNLTDEEYEEIKAKNAEYKSKLYKERFSHESLRIKDSELVKAAFQRDEVKERHRLGQKRRFSSQEEREKASKAAVEAWKNPEYRAKYLLKINEPELKAKRIEKFKEQHREKHLLPLKFVFTKEYSNETFEFDYYVDAQNFLEKSTGKRISAGTLSIRQKLRGCIKK